MAILSKIREKTVVLILIIGMALFAFVIGDSMNSSGGGQNVDVIGEINGETVSRTDFSERLENYKANVGGRVSEIQAMNTVWDGFVREKVYQKQLEEAGLIVGEKDVWESIMSMQFFQNGPQFKNEAGLFDEEKVKQFIADMRDEANASAAGSDERRRWANWLTTENQIRQNLVRDSYTNLVSAGLGVTLDEGKRDYFFNNATVTAQYVYLPYASIPDSLVTIKNSDYKNYLTENAKKYQVEESRSLKYVKFDIVASEEDKEAIKADLATYIEDESNGAKGLRNTTDIQEFLEEAKSDLPQNDSFVLKNKLPKEMSDKVLNGNKGDVFGPYEEGGYYKISKIMDIKKMPDSVKSRHIIIPYAGTQRSNSNRSKEAAKKTVDSIFKLVKNNSSRFVAIADEVNSDGTKGKGGDIGWVSFDTAFSPNFDVDFANYLFENRKGAIDVVETKFGYHIIKIDDQKNFQNATKLAILARQIVPSEATEGKYYQDAEIFLSELSKGSNIDDLAKEKEYKVSLGNKVKELDERVPGLDGSQRAIIRWAFEDDTDINSSKRFEIDGGHVVATLFAKTKKGLATVADKAGELRPILLKKKKAELLNKKMTGATLEEIAKANDERVRNASKVSLASPVISGIGREMAVVGAMSNAKEGQVVKGVDGEKGVFAFTITAKENPTELDNYSSFRNRLNSKIQSKSSKMFEALKESSDIEDNRTNIY